MSSRRFARMTLAGALLLSFIVLWHAVCVAGALLIPGKDGKHKVYMKINKMTDVYGQLLSTKDPERRAVILKALGTVQHQWAPILVSLLLDDETVVEKSEIVKPGRICDFAASALDEYYGNPFGMGKGPLPEAERDAHIKRWQQWINTTVAATFGRDAGPKGQRPQPNASDIK